MQTVTNPLVAIYRNQLEASWRFADAVVFGAYKIDRALIETMRHMVERQMSMAQAMAAARDPGAATNTLQSNLLSRGSEDMVTCQKEMMRVLMEVQGDLGRSMHEYMEQLGTNAATSAAAPMEAAQANARANDGTLDPMSSMLSVWESAFREVTALARKNMAAARTTMEDAAGRAMESAAHVTAAAGNAASSVVASGRESDIETVTEDRKGHGGRRK